MQILALDIETAPNLVHVWGLWRQNVGLPQIIDSGYVLSCAAKWIEKNETDVMFFSGFHDGHKKMIKRIHGLIDKADAVVHFNGTKFDIPTLNKEFLLEGLCPPSPYKQVDLLSVAKSKFRFPSNKLDYIAKALSLGKKTRHIGHELWIRCMNNDPEAWEMMKEYNIQDVILLEKVYWQFLPWIKGHPNHSLYKEDGLVCPNCGSKHYQRRGFQYTNACKYQRYNCQDCGNWFRGTKSEAPKPGLKYVNV